VPDPPPVIMLTPGFTLLGNYSGTGSFTDHDLSGPPFIATVTYGDGGGTESLQLHGTSFNLVHTYSGLLATYTITVTITDNHGVTGTATTTVTVGV
jgi:hypothetical protein